MIQYNITKSEIEENITITMTIRVWNKGVDCMP